MRGEAVLTHDGATYSMQPLVHNNDPSVLYRDSNGTYKQASNKVERSFDMRTISTQAKNPSATGAPVAFAATETGKPKEVRQQPGGLKPRYTPFGTASQPAEVADSDVEMADAPEPVSHKAANSEKRGRKKQD